MGAAAIQALAAEMRGEAPTPTATVPFRLMTTHGVFLPSAPKATLVVHEDKTESSKRNVTLAKDDFLIPDVGMIMVAVDPTRAPGFAGQPITQKYWLGRYEVTQKEWTALMGSNPSQFRGDDLPVDNVSWNDAMDFCRKLNDREQAAGHVKKRYVYTLPTEAQWGYACRAGSADDFCGAKSSYVGWSAENRGAIGPET